MTLHVDASVNDKVRTEDFYVTVYDELPEESADMTLHVMGKWCFTLSQFHEE